MIGGVLLAVSLLLTDPSGDAHGAGDLVPPTAGVYSSSAPFDLVEVEVLEGSTLTLRVRLADRPDPGGLANGITLPVIDLYVDTDEGGREALLPGPGLRMPPEQGWEVAVRVTGDRAFARRAGDEGAVDHPVTVTAQDDALTIATPFAAPEHAPVVHALTGVYDAFDRDAWRPLAPSPSPWAFSSETARFPVVDLLADDDAAQEAALATGVLPQGRQVDPAAPWLVLMVLGLVIAAAGLVLRSRVGRRAPATPSTATPPIATDREEVAVAGEDRVEDDGPRDGVGDGVREGVRDVAVAADEAVANDPMLTYVDAAPPPRGAAAAGGAVRGAGGAGDAPPRPDEALRDEGGAVDEAAADDAAAAHGPSGAATTGRAGGGLPWPAARGWGVGADAHADRTTWTAGGEAWARALTAGPGDAAEEGTPHGAPDRGAPGRGAPDRGALDRGARGTEPPAPDDPARGESVRDEPVRDEPDLLEADLYDAFDPARGPGAAPTSGSAPDVGSGGSDEDADDGPREDDPPRVGRDWR